MKWYTVILLYPDYVAEEYGHETYMTSIEAESPEDAVVRARLEVNNPDEEIDGADFFVIAVMLGRRVDINPER
jgi:hypothetical protein